jgi:hypothetical protein
MQLQDKIFLEYKDAHRRRGTKRIDHRIFLVLRFHILIFRHTHFFLDRFPSRLGIHYGIKHGSVKGFEQGRCLFLCLFYTAILLIRFTICLHFPRLLIVWISMHFYVPVSTNIARQFVPGAEALIGINP